MNSFKASLFIVVALSSHVGLLGGLGVKKTDLSLQEEFKEKLRKGFGQRLER